MTRLGFDRETYADRIDTACALVETPPDAAKLLGIRPRTATRHLADLRAKSGFSTEQLIYIGRAAGWLVVPSLESLRAIRSRAA